MLDSRSEAMILQNQAEPTWKSDSAQDEDLARSNRILREQNLQLVAARDTLISRVRELETKVRRLEEELHGRDLGDEDDSHKKKPWWKRMLD